MRFHGFRPNPPTTQTRTPESLANRLAKIGRASCRERV